MFCRYKEKSIGPKYYLHIHQWSRLAPNYYTRLQGQLKGNVTPKLNVMVLVRFFRPLLDLPDVRLAVLYEYRSVGMGLSGQVRSDNSIPVLAGKQR